MKYETLMQAGRRRKTVCRGIFVGGVHTYIHMYVVLDTPLLSSCLSGQMCSLCQAAESQESGYKNKLVDRPRDRVKYNIRMHLLSRTYAQYMHAHIRAVDDNSID